MFVPSPHYEDLATPYPAHGQAPYLSLSGYVPGLEAGHGVLAVPGPTRFAIPDGQPGRIEEK